MIYISGAITQNPNYLEDFEKAEKIMRQYGEVINPAVVCKELPILKHNEYMKICFTLLDIADEICMMNGWELSAGANQEYGYALAKGKKITFIKEVGNETCNTD